MIDLSWLGGIEFASFIHELTSKVLIDWGSFGKLELNAQFYTGLLAIFGVNIILSGDNAVIIALAVAKLPKRQRMFGILFGTGLAIVLRIILTFVVAKLLGIPLLKLVGGALILYIAVKLFTEGHDESGEEAANLWAALKTIVIADVIMSLDNVLAVAAAAKGDNFLILFGLVTSIPLVVAGSALLSELMRKYPIIVTIGAAILGYVGGGMMITDLGVTNFLHSAFGGALTEPAVMEIYPLFGGEVELRDIFVPVNYLKWTFEAIFTAAVVVVGKHLVKKNSEKAASA